MNKNFKPNERELIKVVTFFKKQSKKLIDEAKLGEEHTKVQEAVDRFVDQMNIHADNRAFILDQRDQLQKLVRDDAECPTCRKKDMLKFVGTDKNEKGWKSNRYRCRRCNIEFTWSRPNNPWDMILYIEEVMEVLRKKSEEVNVTDEEREQLMNGIKNMEENLARMRPVIESHDKDFKAFEEREAEMERLIHEFKNSLLIEKIKMDTWENKKPEKK